MLVQRASPVARPPVLRYGMALLVSSLALLLTWWLFPFVERTVFIFFFAAVILSAWYGGFGPALLTIVFGALSITYLFIPPAFSLAVGIQSLIQVTFFTLIATLIAALTEARARAQQRAHAEGARFRVTLSSIGDAVIVTDTAQRITFMNEVAEQLTGWSQAEALGQAAAQVFRIVNEQTRRPVESPIERVLREGTVVGLANHTALIARDGSERPIADSGAPIRDDAGQVVGVVLVFRDVSASVAAQHAREELLAREQAARIDAEAARAQLASVLDRITDGFLAFDRDWRYTFVNPQAGQMLGQSPEQLLGQSVWEKFPDLLGTVADREMHRAMEQQIPVSYQQHYSPRGISAEARIYPSPDGITLYVRDITEEQRVQQQAARAAERTARLQAVTAALSSALTPAEVADVIVREGVAALKADAGIVALLAEDGTALEILRAVGYPDALVREFQRLPLTAQLPLSEAVQSRTVITIESPAAAQARYPHLVASQRDLQLRAWANIPLLLDGRPIGAMDISFREPRTFNADDRTFLLTLAQQCAQALERARLYQAEQQARAAAEKALQLRDQFLSLAAHELRTPLTSLMGNAYLLQRRVDRDQSLGERDRRTLQTIIDQTNRLNKLILALLDISRIETGQLAIERVPLDVCALVRRVVDEVRPTLGERALELVCPEEPLVVQGDELRLEQVFQNLIQNGIKYSAAPAPVEVMVAAHDGHVTIAVRDHGIGIPVAAQPQLFRRFYRASNAAEQQITGMGIGLYVVKEIVTLHGGEVQVDSTEGVGSTFTVVLPLASRDAPEQPDVAALSGDPRAAADGRQRPV